MNTKLNLKSTPELVRKSFKPNDVMILDSFWNNSLIDGISKRNVCLYMVQKHGL